MINWHLTDTYQENFSASSQLVFQSQEYYRLWTALFVHADLEHFLSNMFLFVPFSILLTNYFSLYVFPLSSILLGGLLNIIVLKTMPTSTHLLGLSGIVYMMAAIWLVLYLLIEKKDNFHARILKVTGIAVALLVPSSFSPNVSYFSHFLGFAIGILIGVITYLVWRKDFLLKEEYKYRYFINDELVDEFVISSDQ